METKAITTIMITLFLASILGITPVSASPGVTFYTVGTATAGWSTEQKKVGDFSVKLYVEDGVEDWAEVSIPVDIAIEAINELKFWEYIESYTPNGWDVNVVLGVDCDGDGFEADVAAWHVVAPHDPIVLGDDSFVEMDGKLGANPATGAWYQIDAFNTPQWWTPDSTGTTFATFYGDFPSFLAWLDTAADDSRIDVGDRVKVLKLLIGGSLNWKDETAYVDCAVINGVTVLDDPGPEDAIALLEDLKDEINGLPNEDLKKPGSQRKKALCNKIDAVINQIEAGEYKGAINKLKKDIRPKLDFDGKSDWLVEAHPELVDKIDLTIAILGIL